MIFVLLVQICRQRLKQVMTWMTRQRSIKHKVESFSTILLLSRDDDDRNRPQDEWARGRLRSGTFKLRICCCRSCPVQSLIVLVWCSGNLNLSHPPTRGEKEKEFSSQEILPLWTFIIEFIIIIKYICTTLEISFANCPKLNRALIIPSFSPSLSPLSSWVDLLIYINPFNGRQEYNVHEIIISITFAGQLLHHWPSSLTRGVLFPLLGKLRSFGRAPLCLRYEFCCFFAVVGWCRVVADIGKSISSRITIKFNGSKSRTGYSV